MSDKNTKNKILNSASHLGFKAQSSRDKLGLVSLEPRLLLDAAGFVTGAEVAVDAMETNDAQTGVDAIFNNVSTPTDETSEQLIRALGTDDYALIMAVADDSDDDTVSLNDDGNYEIHSGETINVDLRANDSGGGTVLGIIDPAAPDSLISLSANESVTLSSGLGVQMLADGTFNVTGPSNPTEPSVSFDYVVADNAGGIHQATTTFGWPEAPTIDLDVVDDPNVEPDEAAGIIPLNISAPINIITDADGNTIQATYSSVATVNGVTVDLVATLDSLDIIEPSTGGNQVTEFRFNTSPFTDDNNDQNFGEVNANNMIPGDFGRAVVTYSLVDQATGNPVPLTFTVLFGDFDGNVDRGTAERITLNAIDIDAYILEDGTGGANDDDTPGTDIILTETVVDGETLLTFAGADNDPTRTITDTGNAVQLVFSNSSSFTVTLERDNAGRNIGFNAAVGNIFGTPIIEDTNTSFENVFIEGADPINVAAQSADVDFVDESDITLLEIEPGNISDGTAEVITFNGDGGTSVSLALDGSDTSQQSLTIGGTDVFIQYNATSGTFEITEQSGAIIPQDDLDALIQAITYENTSVTPTEGEGTDRTLTFRVTDSGGLVSNDAVSTLTVIGVNAAPIANDDGTFSVMDGSTSVIDVVGGTDGASIDTDVENDPLTISEIIDPNGRTPLTITIGNGDGETPIGSTITLASGTELVVNGDGTLTVTGTNSASGIEIFDYTISDGNGGTDSATVTLDFLALTDTDGDGVADIIDVDDDNDGILDVDEGFSAQNVYLLDRAGFEAALAGQTGASINDREGFEGFTGGSIVDTDGAFAPDPADVNGVASLTRTGTIGGEVYEYSVYDICLLYTSPSPRDATLSRMPSSA